MGMMKPFYLLIILFIVSTRAAERRKEYVGISTEDEQATTIQFKSKFDALQISTEDLLPEDVSSKKDELEKLPLGEFVTEVFTLDPAVAEEAQKSYELGLRFLEPGKGHGRDGRLAAFKLFDKASQLGHLEARKLMGFAHLFGDNSRWSVAEAKKIFVELKDRGSPDAQLGLGFMHATGIGIGKQNQAKAFIRYSFAALGDSPLAQMAVGFRYYNGVGVPQNCESALSFYQRVATRVADSVRFATSPAVQRVRLTDESYPTVTTPPGTVPIDNNLLEYYKMLADKGDVSAQLGLGQLYLSGGRGVQQHFEFAHKYFTTAAEAGNTAAFANLGKMYLDGTYATPANNATAFKYFLKAADKSNPSGQAGLGIMFLQGRGVNKNYDKALKLLSLSAEQGQGDGQYYIGKMHFDGIPTAGGFYKRDFKAAVKFFQMASQNGHLLGYYMLAQMHSHGVGVSRSCESAVELYKNVAERGRWSERLMEAYGSYKEGRYDESAIKYWFMAELGYEVAQTNFAHILDRAEATALIPGPRDEVLHCAFINWQRAANQEYALARLKLGDYHYYGYGTPVDHSLAFASYKAAIDRHSVAQAMYNLGYMYEVGEGISKDLYLAKRYYDQALEHSSDAYVPITMALAKLNLVFLAEQFSELRVIKFFDSTFGRNNWDLVAMAFTIILPTALYFLVIRRPNV